MIAVDTNVLVYAVDANEPQKGAKAASLLKELESEPTVLLWQVVCEFGATLLRKKPKSQINISIPEVLVAWLEVFPVAYPRSQVVHNAWRLIDQYQLSYWDAFLIGACIDAGVTRLYTEDLQSRPVIESVEIVNPFQ
jgi:predicted nucleic acid-binding protein